MIRSGTVTCQVLKSGRSDSGFRDPLSIGILDVQSEDRAALRAEIGQESLRSGDHNCRPVLQSSGPDFDRL